MTSVDRTRFTLGLALPTDPRWVDVASMNIEDILVDHAYCEQKAASSCISLIVGYPDKTLLVEMLTPVVAEEWDHFRRVLDELRKRNLTLGAQRKDEYVAALQERMPKGGSREDRLVEQLLLNALIEARSCERFRLLAEQIGDPGLSAFYHELMVSEAGHYKNFLRLAKEYKPEAYVMARWREWLGEEASIVANLAPRGDRMH